MTLQSSINDLGLFDLFQIFHMHRKTGRLIISEGPDGKSANVIFCEGAVCFAVIHKRGVPCSIEALLVEWGVLDETSMIRIDQVLNKYKRLLDCLDGEGIVSKTHLENFITLRIRENVYEIFKWDSGECRFIEEEIDERREILVPLNTENMILEGARRIDEWSNIRNKVPSEQSVFRFGSENEETRALNLKPREWEILSLIDGYRSVNEVNEVVSGDLFSTSKLIYGLVVMGVIELADETDNEEACLSQAEHLEKLLSSGKMYCNRLNFEKAAVKFEKAVQIDPDCFEALRMLGEIHYKMDRLSEALAYLTKARDRNPKNQKTMFIKGYLHARTGEIAQAIKEWEELKVKTRNERIKDLVTHRISVAKEWQKVLQEY